MALTKSLIVQTVVGNQRKEVWHVTPDAAATAFSTGLNIITNIEATVASGVTGATFGVFTPNADVSDTAAKGTVAMTSVVSSGEIKYSVVVYGS